MAVHLAFSALKRGQLDLAAAGVIQFKLLSQTLRYSTMAGQSGGGDHMSYGGITVTVIKNFLAPNKLKLVTWAALLILLFRLPFPLSIVMIYLTTPIMLLTIPLASVGLGNLTLPVIIAYFYILSCVIDLIIQKFHRRV